MARGKKMFLSGGPGLQASTLSARGQWVNKSMSRVSGVCDDFPWAFPGS